MDVLSHGLRGPAFTEKGHKNRSKHVERGHASSRETNGPEDSTLVESLPENLVLAEEAR